MEEKFLTVLVYALPIIFAATVHEVAHGYAARYFGDMTATAQGRLTLNPAAHIDPIGTILLPLVMYFAIGFAIGYPRPIPIDPRQIRGPRSNVALVLSAGVAANFVMAFLWLVFGILLAYFNVTEVYFHRVAYAGVIVNVLWIAYNLLPLPPVDGGQIIAQLLPLPLADRYQRIAPYGFFIIIGLAVLGLLQYWLIPVMGMTQGALNLLASPLTFLLQ